MHHLRSETRELVTLVVIGAVIAITLWWMTRGTTFFFDDWDFVLHPANSISSLLAPHNEHLIAIPRLIYTLLQRTVGLDHYDAWRVVIVAFNVGLSFLVGAIVWKRRGIAVAIGAMLVVGLAGSSWQNLLWAFQITLVGSLICGFAALALLEFRPRALSISISACILAVGAVAFSGIGVATAVMIAAWIIWSRRWRDLWIPILPLGIYAGWRVTEVTSAQQPSSLSTVMHFMWDMAVAVPQGLVGGNRDLGILALFALAAGVVHRFVRTPDSRAWLFALSAGISSEWLLTAISRSEFGEPGASRYVHIGTVFLVLLTAEAISPLARLVSRVASVALGLAVVAATWPLLTSQAAVFRARSEAVRAELTAVELLPDVPPDFYPDRRDAPQVNAADYRSIIGRFGSPAFSTWELDMASDAARIRADKVLIDVLRTLPSHTSAVVDCTDVRPGRSTLQGSEVVKFTAGDDLMTVYGAYFGDDSVLQVVAQLPALSSKEFVAPRYVDGRPWRFVIESSAPSRYCSGVS